VPASVSHTSFTGLPPETSKCHGGVVCAEAEASATDKAAWRMRMRFMVVLWVGGRGRGIGHPLSVCARFPAGCPEESRAGWGAEWGNTRTGTEAGKGSGGRGQKEQG